MEWLFIIGLIIYLIYDRQKNRRLERQVKDLQQELATLRQRLKPDSPAGKLGEAELPGKSRTAEPPPIPSPVPEEKREAPPVGPTPAPKPQPAASPQPAPAPKGVKAAPSPSRTRFEWEQLIGGKWLNRIGAFALILGIGFFLKYAFDHDLIPEWMRVLIGFLVGAYLLFAGNRLSKKGLPIFAQGLAGAGIAILYLSVYASFNFYHLVPQTVALLGMSGVTVLAFQQAMRHHSLAVSLLGWAGGYLTPFLLSTGEAQSVGLLTYIALLTAGLLLVILKRDQWIVLLPLTFVATFSVYLTWRTALFTREEIGIALIFIAIYWGLFHGLDLWCWLKKVKSHAIIRRIISFLNASLSIAIVVDLVDQVSEDWNAEVLFLIGMIYGATFLTADRQKPFPRPIRGQLNQCLFIAAALVIIATEVQFSGYTLTFLFGVEAFLLAFWGIYKKQRSLWLAALALYVVLLPLQLFTTVVTNPISPAEFIPLFNTRALAILATAGAFAAGAHILRRLKGIWRWASYTLHLAWTVLLFFWMTREVQKLFAKLMMGKTEVYQQLLYNRQVWSTVGVWLIYSLVLIRGGLYRKKPLFFYVGLGVFALAAVGSFSYGWIFEPISLYVPLFNLRSFFLGITLLALYLLGRWLTAEKKFRFKGLNIIIATLMGLFLFQLLTAETLDYYRQAAHLLMEQGASQEEITRLSNRMQLTLSMVWLLYSLALMALGIWRRKQGIRLMAFGLFGLTILKIFLFDLSFLETLYRIISFIGLGLILIGVSYVYSRYKWLFLPERDNKAGPTAKKAE